MTRQAEHSLVRRNDLIDACTDVVIAQGYHCSAPVAVVT